MTITCQHWKSVLENPNENKSIWTFYFNRQTDDFNIRQFKLVDHLDLPIQKVDQVNLQYLSIHGYYTKRLEPINITGIDNILRNVLMKKANLYVRNYLKI